MRQFVIIGHEAPTTAEFQLDDLPGAGRLDLLSRCVGAAVFLSHGIRDAVRVHLVLDDSFTVSFDSAELQYLHPDERNIGSRIQGALESRKDAIGHMPADVSPGVTIRRFGVADTLDKVETEGTVVQLHQDGEPVTESAPPSDPVFVLSDHQNFRDAETDLLEAAADDRLRIGPERVHANHAITVVNNWLDTSGYEE
ncbi:MAG: hypothetical protein A07HR60_01258, partial [uncultured archaeon A07HR60]